MKKGMLLWPKSLSTGVYEMDFALKFCPLRSGQLTGLNVVFYDPEEPLIEALKGCYIDVAVVVTDPLSVVSSHAGRALLESVSPDAVIGAVYNESSHPDQIALMKMAYLDVPTFEEVAGILMGDGELREVESLDPACFSCNVDLLRANPSARASDVPDVASKKFFHTGALVHRFGGVFSSEREDLVELIPEGVERVLDVGCAKGGFGRNLMQKRSGVLIDGVEMSAELAREAQRVYNKVYVGKFEDVELPKSFYDVVNMGDVLEHMYDPWYALEKVTTILRSGGYLVGCVPNAAHWSIVKQLLSGEFEYVPSGHLCISHIRFFTPTSLARMLQEAGLEVDLIVAKKTTPTPEGMAFIEAVAKAGVADKDILLTEDVLFRARKV